MSDPNIDQAPLSPAFQDARGKLYAEKLHLPYTPKLEAYRRDQRGDIVGGPVFHDENNVKADWMRWIGGGPEVLVCHELIEPYLMRMCLIRTAENADFVNKHGEDLAVRAWHGMDPSKRGGVMNLYVYTPAEERAEAELGDEFASVKANGEGALDDPGKTEPEETLPRAIEKALLANRNRIPARTAEAKAHDAVRLELNGPL